MAEVASAYVSLLPSAKGFGKQIDSQIGGDLDRSGKSGGKRFGAGFAGSLKRVMGPAVALVGAAAVGSLLKGSIEEAREAQKVGALTESVIKSTGGAAKVTAKQVGDLASSISAKAGMDDEAIQSGANLLLTFKNVRNEAGKSNKIFDQATQAAVDLSAAGFGSVESTSKQLGKALNDPIKGMSALGRAGVTFTEKQKKVIKGFVEQGDLLSAQKIMLREVKSQVGGAAEATATSGEKMSVAWGNLKEQIGTALLPVIDKMATVITTKVVPAISKFVAYLQKNPGLIYAVGGALGAIAVALGVAFVAANLVVVGIAALVAGLIYAYNKFPEFRAAVAATFAAIMAAVRVAMPYVKAVIQGVLDQIIGIVKIFKGIFTGDWKLVWEGVKQVLRGIVGVLKTLLRAGLDGLVAVIKSVGGLIKSAASAAFGRLRDGASAGVGKLFNFVRSIPGKVKDALGNLGSMLYGAGQELIQGLLNGISSMIGKVGDKMRSVASKIKGFLPGSPVKEGPLTSWNNGGAGRRLIQMGLVDGIISQRGAVSSAMRDLTSGASGLTASVSIPSSTRLGPSTQTGDGAGGPRIDPDDIALLAETLADLIETGAGSAVDAQSAHVNRLMEMNR